MVCGTVVPVRALLGIDFVMFRIVAAALGNVSPVKKKEKEKSTGIERPAIGYAAQRTCWAMSCGAEKVVVQ